MQHKIIDLIDFEKVNGLLEGFYKTTGFVTAILDLDGNVLSKSGWQKICTEFHRVNPHTSKKCSLSDTELAGKMKLGEKYHFYRCLNGLIDVAIPITIKGEHIANLFTGQFFFEKPNRDFFQQQASKYGFHEETYLDALEKVPIVSEEKIKIAMEFLLNMTEMIVEMSTQKFEQAQLTASLSESEEKYRLLHEAAGMGIGYYTTEGVVISYNNIAAQNMNGKPEDFAGKSIYDFVPKSIAESIMAKIEKTAHSETPLEYEDEVQLPDGIKWYHSIFNQVINANHKIVGIQIISDDITKRKLAEKELVESKLFFEQLFVQSATSTQLLDKDGWCIKINPKLTELFGVLPEHIEGRKYNIFDDDEIIRTGVVNHIKRVFEHLETVKWEVNFDIQHASESTGVKVSKPEKRWFQNTSYPILNAQGELIYVIIQHEDITTRKLAEQEVIELNKKLEKRVEERTQELSNSQLALLNLVEDLNEKSIQLEQSSEKIKAKNKELETFTYSVSHDLKAPLRGIDGYSRLLEEMYAEKLEEEGQKFVQSIREGTKQMNQLIEDLLAYSRLERSVFRNSKINIKELVETILNLLNREIAANKVSVEANVGNCEIDTDYDGLSIVLRNLLENAIKFSSKVQSPQIKINLKENVNSWAIAVEDNGIGFDMKYHDRIFEIFQRLNLPEQYAGTGIGLAMVSKSVERMCGKVWAESSPGNGAKFYIEIPKNLRL
jgi:PAS domain S-box-containing protein